MSVEVPTLLRAQPSQLSLSLICADIESDAWVLPV